MSTQIIHSARLVTPETVEESGWVSFRDGVVEERGTGLEWRTCAARETTTSIVDAHGAWLTPGFIDIHGHGGGGFSYDNGPEAIRGALDMHRSHGTTRAVISLVSAPVADLANRLSGIAGMMATDGRVLGSHLEGPFLDTGHKGAHEPAFLVEATAESRERLLAAANGTLRQITVAPERPGGMEAVRAFAAAGVTVAVGHTGATYDQAREAFDSGASILTHAFNGMDDLLHRAPGPVAAATRTASVTLEMINDGVHVHPEAVRIVSSAAPGRLALITDAMAAAGAHDGDYLLGTLSVRVEHGIARLTSNGSIAGSTLTLDQALQLGVTEVGLDVRDTIRALTQTPARAIGRGQDLGQLEPGFAADAVLLDDDFRVLRVWCAGVEHPGALA